MLKVGNTLNYSKPSKKITLFKKWTEVRIDLTVQTDILMVDLHTKEDIAMVNVYFYHSE